MLEFKYDTQLLIEGQDLDEDVISDYFTENFKGDCLLAVGDDELIKRTTMQLLQYFYIEPYSEERDFYEQFDSRLSQVKKLLGMA